MFVDCFEFLHICCFKNRIAISTNTFYEFIFSSSSSSPLFCLFYFHVHSHFVVFIAEHHVHFDQTTLKDEDSEEDSTCVTYQQVGENIVDVHLGFLQHNHRYLIELHLPADLFKCQPNVPINLVADNNIAPNVHCKLADRVTELVNETNEKQNEKFYLIKVEYFAHKEKLLREELKLVNANNLEELIKLIVKARVLGKGKGTPMLRNGIHCLGYESDGESSKSDHQPNLVAAGTSK